MSEAFQPGFGARLRAAREDRNLALADVAAKLKLTGRQIEAIETEDFSQLPSDLFVRGFIRNYARLVGVDADDLIVPVDAQAAVSETITAPSAGVSFATQGIKRWVVLPLIGLAAFVLLVALLYHWLRQGEDVLIVDQAAPAAETIQTLPSQTLPSQALPSQALPSQAVPAPPVTPNPEAAPPVPAMQPLAPPSSPAALATPKSAPAPETAAPAARTGSHVLRFEPGLDAWIQVVDGKGQRFSKLVRAGNAESFAGEPPFRLVVGEAARVRLSYDGHTIDLTPFIGQKVARLTLE